MDIERPVVQAWPVCGVRTSFLLDSRERSAYVANGVRAPDARVCLDLVRTLKKNAQ